METIAIHCEPQIEWQAKRAPQFQAGLQALGFNAVVTNNRNRETYRAVLLGTTCWRGIEADGEFLLVDRASYGDPDFVQLVWNGHGRRGDHRVPANASGMRWGMHSNMFEIHEWATTGSRAVLCGQTETWSDEYATLEAWYDRVLAHDLVTHFRSHPAGQNPTSLPRAVDWGDVGLAITLNSSIGVESVMNGIPTVTMDRGAMAWDVTSHDPAERIMPHRRKWLEWLSWTQWSWSEIESGTPIRHLFEGL